MKTILVVDDEPICREPLAEALRGRGFDVVAATGGAAALRAIQRGHIDLVLLDILMPQTEGISVLEQIRSGSRLAQVPVIVLSNVTDRSFVMRTHELGASDYLSKSEFTMDELVRRINVCLVRLPALRGDVPTRLVAGRVDGTPS